jgi:AcrR family transcriptional regulator
MPKLKPDTQLARRQHILDAAERSFARAGFHRTTMQDIAREAGVSLGALYVYFASKEDLIAGITERDRAKLADQLADVAQSDDIAVALAKLGQHYVVDEPRHKQQLVVEIGCEAMRGGAVAEIVQTCDRLVLEQFEALFQRAITDGKIAPSLDARQLALAVATIGDGLFWRRAIDPDFDTHAMVPVLSALVAGLLSANAPAHPTPAPMPVPTPAPSITPSISARGHLA